MVRDGHFLKHLLNNKKAKKKAKKNDESSFKKFMDKAIYFVGLSAPLMTVPQAIKVFIEQDAGGLAISTWSSYILISIMWIVYGVQHKEKPIILTNVAWLIIDVTVVIGILLFR